MGQIGFHLPFNTTQREIVIYAFKEMKFPSVCSMDEPNGGKLMGAILHVFDQEGEVGNLL